MKNIRLVITTIVLSLNCQTGNAQYIKKGITLSVHVSADYIHCTKANDGPNDNEVEVYGTVKVIPGNNICPGGDTVNSKNYKGIDSVLIKPSYNRKMKKGKKLYLNKKSSWNYTFTGNCGLIGDQEIVKLSSAVLEYDHPKEDTLSKYYWTQTVKLSQVLNSKVRTFEFTQSHGGQDYNFDVHFTVKVFLSSDPPKVTPKPE